MKVINAINDYLDLMLCDLIMDGELDDSEGTCEMIYECLIIEYPEFEDESENEVMDAIKLWLKETV